MLDKKNRLLGGCLVYILALVLFSLTASAQMKKEEKQSSFHLGFTPFPHDISQEAVDYVYEKLETHADLTAHHFDGGVPWVEALSGAPYSQAIRDDWLFRKLSTPTGHPIYLAITPINLARTGMADYWGDEEQLPLPPPWDGYAFNHPHVKAAYLNHAIRAVEFFEADYLTIGIESNLLLNHSPEQWDAYLELHRYVYAQLKWRYPNLPIMASIFGLSLLEGYRQEDDHLVHGAAFQNLMLYSDCFAISLYPYMGDFHCDPYPVTMLDDLFAFSDKPIAITETGYPAQRFTVFNGSVTFEGTPAKQKDYIDELLGAVSQRECAFVVNFVLRDYDALWHKADLGDLGAVWKDTGFFDELGFPRPALLSWRNALSVQKLRLAAVKEPEWANWIALHEPVFTGQFNVASDPVLIKEDGYYRMFYTGLDHLTSRTVLCEAFSVDGMQWQNIDTGHPYLAGLVLQGQTGAWDEHMETAYTFFHQGLYRMYYAGYSEPGQPPFPGADPILGISASLGLARSFDGIQFHREPAPLLEPTPGWYDEDALCSPVVIPFADGFFMLYCGHRYDPELESGAWLLGAFSGDGWQWDKFFQPILAAADHPELDWMNAGVVEPALVNGPDGLWYLFFTGWEERDGQESHSLGLAVGPTPLGPWVVNPRPILEPMPGTFCSGGVLAPHVRIEDDRVRMWFLGVNPEHTWYNIGYAEATWPLVDYHHSVSAGIQQQVKSR